MYSPDLIGGLQFGDLLVAQSQSTNAAFTSSAAVSVQNLTGKLLIMFDVSAVTNNLFSVQLYGVTTNAVSGGTQIGNNLGGTAAGPTQGGGRDWANPVVGINTVQVDIESLTPGPFIYAVLTLNGTTHTAVFSLTYAAVKKLV